MRSGPRRVYIKSQEFALVINAVTKRALINMDNEGNAVKAASVMQDGGGLMVLSSF